ncbi:LacI family DNA-binding transcriptional regulator [Rhizobium halophytocola]|uniref:LacI family transcriptional regulator n=1 Tax=Rhizobium halophytocola TaxID=735519 RepID=A0ABS4DTS2_9HYPH|nr:LacI family DNA-binding transcriptional regulator [Rhizobium halophytocola]MBP1849019.1 LacI family transcriptional regulator [Rhizobium halophytocola]
MKPTVHDIAAHAGVSLATVDRVLNRRPGVRAVTRDKVEEAVIRLGYVRDTAAANLAKGHHYPLVFVLPRSDNPFFGALRRAVDDVAERGGGERVTVEIVDVPPFDARALATALDAIDPEAVCGVALVAVDAPSVAAAVARLKAMGLKVVTLVSDLAHSTRDHYAGIDNIAAGRTAASLIGRFAGERGGPVQVVMGSLSVRDHRDRLEGFASVLEAEYPALDLLPVIEGLDTAEIVERALGQALAETPGICAVYSLGAGNRGLIDALGGHDAERHIFTIAHELSPVTTKALESGLIDVVLHQDPGHEVRSAVRVLRAKVDGQPIIASQERIRLDIFLRDNLP